MLHIDLAAIPVHRYRASFTGMFSFVKQENDRPSRLRSWLLPSLPISIRVGVTLQTVVTPLQYSLDRVCHPDLHTVEGKPSMVMNRGKIRITVLYDELLRPLHCLSKG